MPANCGDLRLGIARASLWGAWHTTHRLADDIDVRVLVARLGSTTAAIAVCDLSTLWLDTCLRLRARLAEALGTAPDRVGVFTTQNHGVPTEDRNVFDPAKLEAAFVAAARDALARLAPVEMARVAVRPDPPLVYCRRVAFERLGKFTFWFGFRLDAGGRPDCAPMMKKALARLSRGETYQYRCPLGPGKRPGEEQSDWSPLPVPEPLWLPPADDEILQGLFFRTPDGRPVGSLLRYAAHPDAANHRDADWHSGDYPAYVRRRAEERFGGTALFLTGPCGDQAPPFGEKSLAVAERIGRDLADAALAALTRADWATPRTLSAASPEVALRIRPDYPPSVDAAKQAVADLEAEIKAAAAAGRPVAEIKRLSDQWERHIGLAWDQHRSWTGLDLAGRAGQTITWPLFVMRLGDAAIVGLPGEPFGRFSRDLRDQALGDALLVAEEANGYLSYIPTADEYDLGGYGPNAAIIGPDAEDAMLATLGDFLRP